MTTIIPSSATRLMVGSMMMVRTMSPTMRMPYGWSARRHGH